MLKDDQITVRGMIARVWRGWATPANAPRYQAHFSSTVRPHIEALPGFRGCTLMLREAQDEVEIVATTYWESAGHIRAFTGEDISRAVVEPAARAVLQRFQEDVQHYEVAVAGWR